MDSRHEDLPALREKLSRLQSANKNLTQELSAISKRLQRLAISLGFNDAFEAQTAIDDADLDLTYQQFTETIRAQDAEVKMLRKELEEVEKENKAYLKMPGSNNFPNDDGAVNIDNMHKLVKWQPRAMMGLPQELIDQFIDHLRQDRNTLKVCGLICKAWLAGSRRHLFHSIYLMDSDVDHFILLTKLLGHCYCTFASSIQRIEIWGGDEDGSCHGWLDPLLPHLPKLVSVRSLFIMEAGHSNTSELWRSLIQVQQFTHQITDLTLSSPGFRTFKQYIESICAFPSLVKLTYEDNGCVDVAMEDNPIFIRAPPKSLRVLDITCSYGSVTRLNSGQLILHWLFQTRSVLNTIRLGEIHDVSAHTFSILGSYLRFLGSSLHVLEVSFINNNDISCFLNYVDLRLNPGLRNFELGYHSDIFPQIPRLLSGLPGEALTEVAFRYWIHYNDEPVDKSEAALAETWSKIDQVLSGPRFPFLKMFGLKSYISGVLNLEGLKGRLNRCIEGGVEIYVVNLKGWD